MGNAAGNGQRSVRAEVGTRLLRVDPFCTGRKERRSGIGPLRNVVLLWAARFSVRVTFIRVVRITLCVTSRDDSSRTVSVVAFRYFDETT